MKVSELRGMTDDELRNEEERIRARVFELRAQAVTEKLEDPSLITKARRDIARVETVLREREIQAARQEQPE